MNSKEYSGIKEILNYLPTEDLLSVMGTTTKHLVKAETREEAMKVIMDYSPRSSTILRRKKITRTILFDYLHKHGVTVLPNVEKPGFISACLNYWHSNDMQQNSSLNDIEEDILKMDESFVSPPPPPPQPQPSMLNQTIVHLHNNAPVDQNINKVSQLGLLFSNWFFDVLNYQRDFGPQHFWPDCKLWLHSKVSGMKEEEFCIMGSNNVAAHLSNYVTSKSYFFKPNNTDSGIKTTEEEHGLIKVVISGVVHQLSNCIGLFDFVFGLVCDPVFNDNWKIKQLSLVLQVNNNSGNTINYYPQNMPYICQ